MSLNELMDVLVWMSCHKKTPQFLISVFFSKTDTATIQIFELRLALFHLMYNPDILCGNAPFKNVEIWQNIFTFFSFCFCRMWNNHIITWQTCEFWLWLWVGGQDCQTIRVGQEKCCKVLDHKHVHKIHVALVVWPACFMTCLFYASCSNTPCHYTPLLNLCLLIFGVMSFGWLCWILQPSTYSIILRESIIFYLCHTFSWTH